MSTLYFVIKFKTWQQHWAMKGKFIQQLLTVYYGQRALLEGEGI